LSMKVSSSKGKTGAKRQGQKYQNTIAFTPNKHSPVALKIAMTAIKGVCQRCLDILEWKKRLNKYKPLTQPKTCIFCSRRTIVEAYHVVCQSCAKERQICAKCHQSNDIVESQEIGPSAEETKAREEKIQSLSERSRRTYLRLIEKDDPDSLARADLILQSAKDCEWSDEEDV
jgi:hypothetical protein